MNGYIYRSKCLINNKMYIGKRTSSFFDKDYFGRGKLIQEAIKTYGRKNFSVEIIEEIDDLSILDDREKYWISYYNAVDSSNYYNMAFGGNAWNYDPSKFRNITGENNPFYGKHHTEETKSKMRKHHRDVSGKNNPFYGKSYNRGTIWITNGKDFKRIKSEELDYYTTLGFVKGRVIK